MLVSGRLLYICKVLRKFRLYVYNRQRCKQSLSDLNLLMPGLLSCDCHVVVMSRDVRARCERVRARYHAANNLACHRTYVCTHVTYRATPSVMVTGNVHRLYFVKLGCVVSEICERTDRQTDRRTHHCNHCPVKRNCLNPHTSSTCVVAIWTRSFTGHVISSGRMYPDVISVDRKLRRCHHRIR